MRTKGFTLTELVVSLGIMALLSIMALPIVGKQQQTETIISEMLKQQTWAILSNSQQVIIVDGVYQFHYNNKGNVSNALSFDYAQHRIIVRLGYGNIRYE